MEHDYEPSFEVNTALQLEHIFIFMPHNLNEVVVFFVTMTHICCKLEGEDKTKHFFFPFTVCRMHKRAAPSNTRLSLIVINKQKCRTHHFPQQTLSLEDTRRRSSQQNPP